MSPGGLPRGLTLAELGHKSVRRNALIADLLHRIGFIEKAGTGIRHIRENVRAQGCAEPEFESGSFFTATFRPNPDVRARADEQPRTPAADQVTREVRLLRAISGEMTRLQIQQALGLTHSGHFRAMYLRPALEAGLIEMTVPDKPRSKNQRYRLTTAGREYLRRTQEP